MKNMLHVAMHSNVSTLENEEADGLKELGHAS